MVIGTMPRWTLAYQDGCVRDKWGHARIEPVTARRQLVNGQSQRTTVAAQV